MTRGKKFFKRSVYIYAMGFLFLLVYVTTTETGVVTGSPVSQTADAVIAVGAGLIAVAGLWRARRNAATGSRISHLLLGVGGLIIAAASLARFTA